MIFYSAYRRPDLQRGRNGNYGSRIRCEKMSTLEQSPVYDLATLERYARESLDAEQYVGDIHRFVLANCPGCGLVPMSLTIEHHSGSKKGNFRGVVWGSCQSCKKEHRIFSYTGTHRKLTRKVNPSCRCGNAFFVVGECQRFEGEEGLVGFFDEGVLVGQCVACRHNQAFIYMD